ncbi:GGDEF domain-containing protein [Corallincola luteus]|uniref:diguanylate cyclase n=1 Tax=Corallincola luteus TaxID=1775177 RepID=A0ABY2AS03_9GAMM|nr:GGDEF domain-containing protein [Corallincola luteus]TCI04902.1 GGDEF domain-containing protein [Corallincola luteus]
MPNPSRYNLIARLLITVYFLLPSLAFAQTSFPVLEKQLSEIDNDDHQQALKVLARYRSDLTLWSVTEQARFYRLNADHQIETGQLDIAKQNYDRSIGILMPLGASIDLVHSLLERSYIRYVQTNDREKYCPDRVIAEQFARALDNDELLVKALTQLAFCNNDDQQFDKGLKLLQEALSIAQRSNLSSERVAMIYNATALIYKNNGLNSQAYEHFSKAYQQWQSVDDKVDMVSMLHGMVGAAIEQAKWQQAKQHVGEMFELANSAPEHPDFEFFAYYNAGRNALAKHELELATGYLAKALDRQANTAEKFFVKHTYALLAEAHLRNQAWQQAYRYAEQCLTLLQSSANELNDSRLLCQAIIAAQQNVPQITLQAMLQLVDKQTKAKRDFVNNAILKAALTHNEKLTQFENQLLLKQVEINELALLNEKDQRKIAYLTIAIFVLFMVASAAIIIFLARSRKVLQHRAETDFLTGIANRRRIFEHAQRLIERAAHNKDPLSIIIFDIDHFKQINDNYGHNVGDLAIQQIARLTANSLRPGDIVGRIGGEEFLVVLPNTQELQAQEVAERLRAMIASTKLEIENQSVRVTVSLGVCTLDKQRCALQSIINAADEALYFAKNAGRNQVKVSPSSN